LREVEAAIERINTELDRQGDLHFVTIYEGKPT
jgi:hypothetical protein